MYPFLLLAGFSPTNSQGQPTNPATASPTLDTHQLLATVAVTEVAPEASSADMTILDSQYYGLGADSTNLISGAFYFSLSAKATVKIFTNGDLQREYTEVPPGVNIIDFADPALPVNITFGDVVTVEVVREDEDAVLSAGKMNIYQVS